MASIKKKSIVRWTTTKGTVREGEVVAIVPKGEDCTNAFYRLNQDKYRYNGDIKASGYARDEKSYLVAVKIGNGRLLVFWPPVNRLELIG